MLAAVAPAPTDAFRSLDELRRRHDELAASVGEAESIAGHEEPVEAFVRRAVATGAVLDAADDRRAAQALVNFWASLLDRRGSENEADGVQPPSHRTKSSELLLKPFAADALDAVVIQPADRWLGEHKTDQELAKRILLRLVRLPEKGDFEMRPS